VGNTSYFVLEASGESREEATARSNCVRTRDPIFGKRGGENVIKEKSGWKTDFSGQGTGMAGEKKGEQESWMEKKRVEYPDSEE